MSDASITEDPRTRPTVLVAHEQALIGRAVQRVLDLHGFDVDWCASGEEARLRLKDKTFDAFVVDVGLPDGPGLLLIDEARATGVKAIVLAAAVYRKTSYKRRPNRLYGADDYVEVHHLGDHLPQRLRYHLGMNDVETEAGEAQRIHELLESIGDARLDRGDDRRLAELLVADMLLYNGDVIGLGETPLVRDRLKGQLDDLGKLFIQVQSQNALQHSGESLAAGPARVLIAEALTHFLANSTFSEVAEELNGTKAKPPEADESAPGDPDSVESL